MQTQLSLDEAIRQAEAPAPKAQDSAVLTSCACCGHAQRVYRRTLRPAVVAGLRELVKGPMNTRELVGRFSGPLAASIKSYFAEALLWGFVEKREDGRWEATAKAGAFLRGEIQVFRHKWPRAKELPAWCEDADLVYVTDVA